MMPMQVQKLVNAVEREKWFQCLACFYLRFFGSQRKISSSEYLEKNNQEINWDWRKGSFRKVPLICAACLMVCIVSVSSASMVDHSSLIFLNSNSQEKRKRNLNDPTCSKWSLKEKGHNVSYWLLSPLRKALV